MQCPKERTATMSLIVPVSVSLKSDPSVKGTAVGSSQTITPDGKVIPTFIVCFEDDDGTIMEIPIGNLRWESLGDLPDTGLEDQGPEDGTSDSRIPSV